MIIAAPPNHSSSEKTMAPCKAWSHWNLRIWTGCLVAGDCFGRLFGGLRAGRSTAAIGMPVAVRMAFAIAISARRGDGYRLARVREISRHRLSDVADRADLHDRRLRLLQHQLFVNRANLGLFFISLLAASAVLFRRGHRNVVLQVAHASGVFGVNLQGMLKTLQVDGLAFGVNLVLPVVLVPG